MVTFTLDSRISYLFELMNGSSPTPSRLDTMTLDNQFGLELFDELNAMPVVTEVASDRVVLADTSTGHSIILTGSGFSPVGSAAELEAAIDGGLASGAFDRVEMRGPMTIGGTPILLMALDITATGYTLTTGDQRLTVTGSVPGSMAEFYAIADALTPYGLGTQDAAARSVIVSTLTPYGITGLIVEDNISGTPETVLDISVSSTALSASFDGYTFSLTGTFPPNLGALAQVAFDINDVESMFGVVSSLAQLPGIAITGGQITGPDGGTLMTMTGEVTDQASVDNATIIIDGQTIDTNNVDLMMGSDENYWDPANPYHDWLQANPGRDTILFGLAGNDYLVGDTGNDSLFGGTGNDWMIGGDGDDYFDPGGPEAESWDGMQTGRGNDTVDFSDTDMGGGSLQYADLSGGIAVTLNGVANTGSVVKGGGALGTDTIIAPNNPMNYWGLEIVGTMFDDTLAVTFDSINENWLSHYWTGGSNEITILGGTGKMVMNYAGASTGIAANIASGRVWIGPDVDTISGHDADIVVELRGSSYTDTLVGSDNDDTFVLLTGDDTANGAGGVDTVRYDRGGVGAITANLATGIATGTWYGTAFTHTLQNIENLRGSRDEGDALVGSDAANELDGRGGDDLLNGGLGNDTLIGGDGNDTALFGVASTDISVAADDMGVTVTSSDGIDVVMNDVETFHFTDGMISAADLRAMSGIEDTGTSGNDNITGGAAADTLGGGDGADRIDGGDGDDSIEGGDGADTLIGGAGNDTLLGGDSENDQRDVIYGGAGDDYIDGGYGNDELNGGGGADTVAGGFGADTVFGFDGSDVLTGSAWSDLIYGGAGDDFINGGFGYDRVNGGDGADRFYHLGVADHGTDWVQDYTAADGDVLLFGGGAATAADFLVQFAETANAGQAGVTEAFVTYRPTGQVLWALIDGGGQAELNLMAGGQVFDLLA